MVSCVDSWEAGAMAPRQPTEEERALEAGVGHAALLVSPRIGSEMVGVGEGVLALDERTMKLVADDVNDSNHRIEISADGAAEEGDSTDMAVEKFV